jgi:hypothetical protein
VLVLPEYADLLGGAAQMRESYTKSFLFSLIKICFSLSISQKGTHLLLRGFFPEIK